jgi:DNA polymerase-3 subunit alpha
MRSDERSRMLPPDVNASEYEFVVAGPEQVRYGLGAIKGVGRAAVEALTEERAANGPYAASKIFAVDSISIASIDACSKP